MFGVADRPNWGKESHWWCPLPKLSSSSTPTRVASSQAPPPPSVALGSQTCSLLAFLHPLPSQLSLFPTQPRGEWVGGFLPSLLVCSGQASLPPHVSPSLVPFHVPLLGCSRTHCPPLLLLQWKNRLLGAQEEGWAVCSQAEWESVLLPPLPH
uniref:Uncharacterized protein n=1 Tax=Sphaerodactylus townsendi TaxID=933632 RepID=A0ACB8FV95_9SAUR